MGFFKELNARHPLHQKRTPPPLEEEQAPPEGLELMSPKKSVSFASLDIRSYSVTIGDHPCCVSGCPLTLDWDYTVESSNLSIDLYEASRSPRRSRKELRTTSEQRHQILSEDHGVSDGDLRRSQRQLFRARSSSAKLCERMSASFFVQEGL
jgi:hypothetical protein